MVRIPRSRFCLIIISSLATLLRCASVMVGSVRSLATYEESSTLPCQSLSTLQLRSNCLTIFSGVSGSSTSTWLHQTIAIYLFFRPSSLSVRAYNARRVSASPNHSTGRMSPGCGCPWSPACEVSGCWGCYHTYMTLARSSGTTLSVQGGR